MTHENPSNENWFREAKLQGRSPIEFIQDDVRHQKEYHQELVKRGIFQNVWSDYNLAELLCGRIASGIITEEEITDALPHLGMTFEQANRFLEEIIPQTMRLLETQQKIQGVPEAPRISYFAPSE